MIVDDNSTMRRLIGGIVADLAEVIEANDGSDAVALYELCRPDWVLMDMRMNRVSGIEATRRITAVHPNARIVMVTEYDDKQLRDAAREAGACNYVVKDDLFSLRGILQS